MSRLVEIIRFVVLALQLLFIDRATASSPRDRGSRIVGGTRDVDGKVKYQVALHDGYRDFCGGTIIDERHVLTAAHCVIGHSDKPNPSYIYAIIGGTNVLSWETKEKMPTVEKIFVPATFNASKGALQYGDIAILKLDRPVRLLSNPNVTKVELPKQLPDGSYDDYEDEVAVIAGFGAFGLTMKQNKNDPTIIESDRKFYPDEILIGTARVMNQRECEDIFDGFVKIHTVQMCARMQGPGYHGTCTGDGGNGLVLNNVIIGIASFGHELCYEGTRSTPTVYTRVTPYLTFINYALQNAPHMDLRTYYMYS